MNFDDRCDGPLRKLTGGFQCEHGKPYPDCYDCREYCESCDKVVYGYNHIRRINGV